MPAKTRSHSHTVNGKHTPVGSSCSPASLPSRTHLRLVSKVKLEVCLHPLINIWVMYKCVCVCSLFARPQRPCTKAKPLAGCWKCDWCRQERSWWLVLMDLKEDGCVDVYDPTTVPETCNSGIYTVGHSMCLCIPSLSVSLSLFLWTVYWTGVSRLLQETFVLHIMSVHVRVCLRACVCPYSFYRSSTMHQFVSGTHTFKHTPFWLYSHTSTVLFASHIMENWLLSDIFFSRHQLPNFIILLSRLSFTLLIKIICCRFHPPHTHTHTFFIY